MISTKATAGSCAKAIRVRRGEDLRCVFLVEIQSGGVKKAKDVLVFPAHLSDLRAEAVGGLEFARDQHVEICVDAVRGQLGDEVLQAVETLGGDLAGRAGGVIYQNASLVPRGFEMVQANRVEAEAGQAGRVTIG